MLEQLEKIRADQFDKWHGGERVLAESYFELHPALAANPEAAVDVIYSEILLREKMGETIRGDEYTQRFPQYAPALERQLQLHDLFRNDLVDDTIDGPPTAAYPQADALGISA